MLDAVAAMLSLGKATHQIAADPLRETGLSQVFVAMDPAGLGGAPDHVGDEIVESLHACTPAEAGSKVRHPGERTLQIREENRRLGLPTEDEIWAEILAL